MTARRFIVEADGGSRGNPGPAGYGALVRDADTGRLLAERAEQLRDDALADIADGTTRHESARAEVVGLISAPLLTLYDRIRAQTGGTGAAMLRARACQGCRIELYGNQLNAVRNADPHEVVRCENCGRILVRTAESGL